MDVEEEPSNLADEDIQAPVKPVGVLLFSLYRALLITSFSPWLRLPNLNRYCEMVHLVNNTFRCLISFNLDLRAMYDQTYDLLCFLGKFLTVGITFKKMTFCEDASTELQTIVELIDQLQGLSSESLRTSLIHPNELRS